MYQRVLWLTLYAQELRHQPIYYIYLDDRPQKVCAWELIPFFVSSVPTSSSSSVKFILSLPSILSTSPNRYLLAVNSRTVVFQHQLMEPTGSLFSIVSSLSRACMVDCASDFLRPFPYDIPSPFSSSFVCFILDINVPSQSGSLRYCRQIVD